MEYEIVNSLITNTVSTLFENRSKHIKYFLNTSIDKGMNLNENKSVDIPKTSNRKNKQSNLTDNNNSTTDIVNESKKNSSQTQTIQSNSNTNSSNNTNTALSISTPIVKSDPSTLTIEFWMNDSKRKQEVVYKKLGLNENKTSEKYLNTLKLDQLEVEKCKLKKELQEIDKDFLKIFKKNPVKHEKECLRTLYVYYTNLKNAIALKSGNSKSSSVDSKQSSNTVESVIDDRYNIENNNTTKKDKDKEKNKDKDNTNVKDKDNKNDNKENDSKINTINNNNNTKKEKDKENEDLKLDDNKTLSQYVIEKLQEIKSYNYNQLKEMETKLNNDQQSYKKILYDYQKDFLLKNNRKVKYYKDVYDVRFEYNSYKDNKILLKEIEDRFKNLKISNI